MWHPGSARCIYTCLCVSVCVVLCVFVCGCVVVSMYHYVRVYQGSKMRRSFHAFFAMAPREPTLVPPGSARLDHVAVLHCLGAMQMYAVLAFFLRYRFAQAVLFQENLCGLVGFNICLAFACTSTLLSNLA